MYLTLLSAIKPKYCTIYHSILMYISIFYNMQRYICQLFMYAMSGTTVVIKHEQSQTISYRINCTS